MARSKLIRFAAAALDDLVVQNGKEFFDRCAGHRCTDYFHNLNPIILELACGRGEYTVGMSHVYPDHNYIGIDLKVERIMQGVHTIRSQDGDRVRPNVSFIRTIIHHLDRFFVPWEVQEIWIIHPDPRPKGHDERRRLTFKRFLDMYHTILAPDGLLRLKTDNTDLFDYSVQSIQDHGKWQLVSSTHDLYQSPELLAHHHGIQTHYEKHFVAQGETVKYGIRKKL
jgi:tRNA (guanine-N7-)-methyltransferase